jgi:hypothetical protein
VLLPRRRPRQPQGRLPFRRRHQGNPRGQIIPSISFRK